MTKYKQHEAPPALRCVHFSGLVLIPQPPAVSCLKRPREALPQSLCDEVILARSPQAHWAGQLHRHGARKPLK